MTLQMFAVRLQQHRARRVLQLRAQREIVAHAVFANAHQRPFVADQSDAFFRRQHLIHRVAQLVAAAALS